MATPTPWCASATPWPVQSLHPTACCAATTSPSPAPSCSPSWRSRSRDAGGPCAPSRCCRCARNAASGVFRRVLNCASPLRACATFCTISRAPDLLSSSTTLTSAVASSRPEETPRKRKPFLCWFAWMSTDTSPPRPWRRSAHEGAHRIQRPGPPGLRGSGSLDLLGSEGGAPCPAGTPWLHRCGPTCDAAGTAKRLSHATEKHLPAARHPAAFFTDPPAATSKAGAQAGRPEAGRAAAPGTGCRTADYPGGHRDPCGKKRRHGAQTRGERPLAPGEGRWSWRLACGGCAAGPSLAQPWGKTPGTGTHRGHPEKHSKRRRRSPSATQTAVIHGNCPIHDLYS